MNEGVPMRGGGLLAAVDAVPETRGSGVVLRRGPVMQRLRRQPSGGVTVVFEIHERDMRRAYLETLRERRGPFRDNPTFSTGAQVRPAGWSVTGEGITRVPHTALTRRPGASVGKRDGGTSVANEWKGLGFNCGGAALAWVGVVGAGAATPVTGGLTFGAALLLYTGAVASSAQCVVSIARVRNAHTGKQKTNEWLDDQGWYRWTMRGADVVGLAGAGAALKELKAADGAFRASGAGWSSTVQRTATAAQRRAAAGALGLEVGTTGSRVLSQLARGKLLDGAAATLGIYSSADGGVIREVIVWVAKEA